MYIRKLIKKSYFFVMRTRRGRLWERHSRRLFCQDAAKVFISFIFFKKKIWRRHLLRGCFVRSLQSSYVYVCILKKQKQKHHNSGGGVKLRPPRYAFSAKKKNSGGGVKLCPPRDAASLRYAPASRHPPCVKPGPTIDCFFLKTNKIPKEHKRKSHG